MTWPNYQLDSGVESTAQEAGLTVYRSVDVREQEFNHLMEKWREERDEFSSFLTDWYACSSYMRIVGLGRSMLPLIIQRLEAEDVESGHWCAALEAITGHSPLPEGPCNVAQMAEAWVEWYRTQIFQTSTPTTIESIAQSTHVTTASPGRLVGMTSGGSPTLEDDVTAGIGPTGYVRR